MKSMHKSFLFLSLLLLSGVGHIFGQATPLLNNSPQSIENLPRTIYCEGGAFHVQGVAVDIERGYAYFSFTTKLIKTDLEGNIIGSVEGLIGHLGCIDINPDNGHIYASLEYKTDGIGKGILEGLGDQAKVNTPPSNAFYIAIFEPNKITRVGMSAEADDVLSTVYLKEVLDDYSATVINNGQEVQHRYGCSGIDGLAFGPQFGKSTGKNYLNVSYGVYGDLKRTDNDYQVILQYDVKSIEKHKQPLSQDNIHTSGPAKVHNKYFVFTGNTTYGIQNLEYDPNTNYWFAAVYKGKKEQYPNYPLYTIDGSQKPVMQTLKGFDNKEKGKVLKLVPKGILHETSSVYGWQHKWGATGIHSLGNGYFYISEHGTTKDKIQYSKLKLCRWTGELPDPFEVVK